MSVYKVEGKPNYQYYFRYKGARFSSSTGTENEREAKRFETRRREEVKAEYERRQKLKAKPMSLDLACGDYWADKGIHHPKSMGTFKNLAFIMDRIGADKTFAEITNGDVAEAIAFRRRDGVSNATVNRTVIEPLRSVVIHAREIWKVPVPDIEWKRLRLPEPKARIRELAPEAEEKLFKHIREDYRPIVDIALLTGMRMSEMLNLQWSDIDWGNRKITIMGKGKKIATIPLMPDVRDILWELREHHDKQVFTYARARGEKKGQRAAMTMRGLQTEWKRARKAAGMVSTGEDIMRGYRFHDNRHTTATRLLRASGNIALVQKLLRHSDIKTTARYAQALDQDLRDALEKVPSARQRARSSKMGGAETGQKQQKMVKKI